MPSTLTHSIRCVLVCLCAFALNASCGEDDPVQIGPRATEAAPQKISPEQFQAVIQRILKAPAPAGNEQNEKVVALTLEARSTPELFTPLLIPAGAPNAIPKADKEVRVRTATLLGLSADRRALQPLINSAIYDPDEKVRAAAGFALPKLEEPSAMRKLMDVAIARDPRRFPWAHRKSACAALRRYGDLAVVDRILKELSYELAAGNPLDPKNKPRGVASGIATDNPMMLPDTAPPSGIPEEDMYPIMSALKEVTRAELPPAAHERDLRSWQRWWRDNKGTFKFAE